MEFCAGHEAGSVKHTAVELEVGARRYRRAVSRQCRASNAGGAGTGETRAAVQQEGSARKSNFHSGTVGERAGGRASLNKVQAAGQAVEHPIVGELPPIPQRLAGGIQDQ